MVGTTTGAGRPVCARFADCGGLYLRRLAGRTPQCLNRGLLWLSLLLLAAPAQAFGERGHELVAQLATYYLSDDAHAMVTDLYGENYRRALLEDANYAAQLTRERGNEWRLGYHYTWFTEGDDGYSAAQHCPNNLCSVSAVMTAEQVLLSANAKRNQRRDAFRMLMHFMADLHDPMNAGFRADRGGRELELQASDLSRHTLYNVWQEGLFDHLPHAPFVMANAWSRSLSEEQRREWQRGEPASWVWETHEMARDLAYPLVERAGGWNARYRREAMPALEVQLKKAAVRLAVRLNMIAASNPATAGMDGVPALLDF